MTRLSDKSERGLDVIGRMMDRKYSDALRQAATSGKFGSTISRMALDFAFADTWGRENWDKKQRSLVVISLLVALRQTNELKTHVKIGVTNGLKVEDLEEILIQATPYVGFPCITSASTAVIEALREIGMDVDAKTAEERGLL